MSVIEEEVEISEKRKCVGTASTCGLSYDQNFLKYCFPLSHPWTHTQKKNTKHSYRNQSHTVMFKELKLQDRSEWRHRVYVQRKSREGRDVDRER